MLRTFVKGSVVRAVAGATDAPTGNDEIIEYSAACTVTVPSAATYPGLPLTLIRTGSGLVTINLTLDGVSAVLLLTAQYDSVAIVSNGTTWRLRDKSIVPYREITPVFTTSGTTAQVIWSKTFANDATERDKSRIFDITIFLNSTTGHPNARGGVIKYLAVVKQTTNGPYVQGVTMGSAIADNAGGSPPTITLTTPSSTVVELKIASGSASIVLTGRVEVKEVVMMP